jgi:hypothetical protein
VNQGTCPNSLLFRYLHLKLTFEFIEELASASIIMVGYGRREGFFTS